MTTGYLTVLCVDPSGLVHTQVYAVLFSHITNLTFKQLFLLRVCVWLSTCMYKNTAVYEDQNMSLDLWSWSNRQVCSWNPTWGL